LMGRRGFFISSADVADERRSIGLLSAFHLRHLRISF
jgi:hypothetical protein